MSAVLSEYVASGFVDNGELHIRNRRGFDRAIAQMRSGEVVVTVEKRRATRSQRQNRWYWGQIVKLISMDLGYDPNDIHDILKTKLNPKEVVLATRDGEIVDELVIGGSTRKMNRIDFGAYCDAARRWAFELRAIEIPDPDPEYWRDRQGNTSEESGGAL